MIFSSLLSAKTANIFFYRNGGLYLSYGIFYILEGYIDCWKYIIYIVVIRGKFLLMKNLVQKGQFLCGLFLSGKLIKCVCRSMMAGLWLLLFFSPLQHTHAQLTIMVDKVAENTPANDTLYLVGSFNGWDPGDKNYVFTKVGEGKYSLSLPSHIQSFQYKITRGSWEKVEGSLSGKPISNRFFTKDKEAGDSLYIQVAGWEDLPAVGAITFVLNELPSNTPHDASIYIAGNFNDWNPADPYYKLSLQPDNTYKVSVPAYTDTLYYKFTRGTWASVESRASGRAIYNRIYIRKDNEPVTIQAKINAWEDLASGFLSIYTFILLMAICQGVFLIIAISGMPNRNKKPNAILSVLILLVSISLLGRLASYESAVFNFQPKLLLLSDIVLFLFCPLFYLYMQSLLTIQVEDHLKKIFHFIPAGIHFLIYLPLLFVDRRDFINNIIDLKYFTLFAAIGGVALIFNIFYCTKCYQLLRHYKQNLSNTYSYEENLTYLSTFLKLIAVCLAIWGFSFFVYMLDYVIKDINPRWINETTVDILWVVFSVSTYFFGYYAMTQPEIFIFMQPKDQTADDKHRQSILPDDNLQHMKEELSLLMAGKKPYLNPKLGLQDLAEMLNSNVHTISRVINEGYEKNFYDLINEYRIEEFKEMISSDQYKNYTYLAIALEVGFSSKTTFYRAFKKYTGKTPREYFALVNQHGLAGVK
jgi:AraC-like DNA-binding protein